MKKVFTILFIVFFFIIITTGCTLKNNKVDLIKPKAQTTTMESSTNNLTPTTLRSIKVTDSNALKSAIKNVKAGDHIILGNGNYTLGTITATGTSENPIFIEAENNSMAVVTSGNTILDSCNYLILNGLKFTSNQTIDIKNTVNCRITRNTLNLSENNSELHWIRLEETSNHNRIDHNLFLNKTINGNFITFSGVNAISQYTRIDHNHFKNTVNNGINGTEAIRIGVGAISKFSGFATVEYNLFEDCDGDAEVISSKSCDNIIRYNTIINSTGSISLRQGARCEVNNNIILGNNKTVGKSTTGGIKVYGQDHLIHDNYIEKCTGKGDRAALVIGSGDVDLSLSSDDGIHPRVNNAKVYNNILYNNLHGIVVGGNKYAKYSPTDCSFTNNKVQQNVNSCYDIYAELNSTWTSNLAWPTGKAVVGYSNGVTVSNPQIDYAAYENLALTPLQVGPLAK